MTSMPTFSLETMPGALQRHPAGRRLHRILSAAWDAANAQYAVDAQLSWDGETLAIGTVRLQPRGRIFVLGAGKASVAVAAALHRILGERITGGLIVTKHQPSPTVELGAVKVMLGGHPLPDDSSVRAGQAAMALAQQAQHGDLVLCPISGGASALWISLVDLELADLRAQTGALLQQHVPIGELNRMRSSGDALKAGGLALAASPADVLGLIVSDVSDQPLHVVGSGPTFAPGVPNHRLLGIDEVIDAALQQAEAEGFEPVRAAPLTGPARAAGIALASQVDRFTDDRMRCFVAGGETTVRVDGPGLGGRNLEVALAAAPQLMGLEHALFATLATDGEDGPSGAAGAVVSGDTIYRALEAGLDPDDHLRRNDSHRFFEQLGDLFVPGPSMTNVGDLAILLA